MIVRPISCWLCSHPPPRPMSYPLRVLSAAPLASTRADKVDLRMSKPVPTGMSSGWWLGGVPGGGRSASRTSRAIAACRCSSTRVAARSGAQRPISGKGTPANEEEPE